MEPCNFSLPQGVHLCMRHFEGNKQQWAFLNGEATNTERIQPELWKIAFPQGQSVGSCMANEDTSFLILLFYFFFPFLISFPTVFYNFLL